MIRLTRWTLRSLIGAVTLVPALALALAPQTALGQGLTPEQVVALRTVTSVAMSPDGQWIAYTATRPRDEVETQAPPFSELWVVPVAGGEPRLIVGQPHTVSAPRWTPDGRTLAFAATLPAAERRQVWGVDPAGGEPRPLTSSPRGVGLYAFSPDGTSIAFTESVSPPEEIARRRAAGNDVVVASEPGTFMRLAVQGPGGQVTPITPEDRVVHEFAWSPDGSWLAVQWTEETTADAELMFREMHSVAADGSWARPLVATEGKLGPMAFSPRGDVLAWLGATEFNDPLAQSVFVVPLREAQAADAPLNLTAGLEASAEDLGWLDDRTVWFVASESTRTRMYRVRDDGTRLESMMGGGAEIFRTASFDDRRRTVALAASTARHPNEVFAGTPGRELRRLTDHNPWLADVALGEQETVAWVGPEGWVIEGVVTRPVGFVEGQRYPLAILPHGGPEGVDLDGWHTNPLYPTQVLAGLGYVVFRPNYRGSGGRGVVFSKGDHRDLGGREMEDILYGIDYLTDQGWVDPYRVGISGTSYGGYLSAWAATRFSDRFQVAIPFAGLTNWISFTGTTDIPIEMMYVHFDLPIFGNYGVYMDRSPISHLGGASTPTLIGHGLADDRVHPEQSIQLYNLMRLAGIPVDLVLYPREPHGLRERAHQLDYMGRIVEWFNRYLK
jgi:dipeptidyl aminopeptidase/acylaminoacyl peptidase